MKFNARQPDGRMIPVVIGNFMATASILLASLVVALAWLAAYCQHQSETQRGTSYHSYQRSMILESCCKWPSQQPQAKTDDAGGDGSMVMSFLTGVIAVAAVMTWLVYAQMRDHNIAISRAYVTLSHQPPGLVVGRADKAQMRNISVNIWVTNHGQTPAIVTAHLLTLVFADSLHEVAAALYVGETPHIVRVSVVRGDRFNVFANWLIPAAELERVHRGDGGLRIYLIGFVDYIDKFGRRHGAGYARVYDPLVDNRDQYTMQHRHPEQFPGVIAKIAREFDENAFNNRNNLPFVTEPGFNYDRPRQQGEGSDWDEN